MLIYYTALTIGSPIGMSTHGSTRSSVLCTGKSKAMPMKRFAIVTSLQLDVFRAITLPIWVVLCTVLGAAFFGRLQFGIPWQVMMGDPASATGAPFYLGFVSNVGAMLWASAASVFLFGFRVHRSSSGGDSEWGRFLLYSGVFVGVLGSDDLFMLHDQVFPDYLSVDQSLVIATYAVLALLYAMRFASLIAQTAYPVLIAAMGLLAVSVTLDQLSDNFSMSFRGEPFCEDAAKLLGIGAWLSYAIHTAAAAPRQAAKSSRSPMAAPRFTVQKTGDPI